MSLSPSRAQALGGVVLKNGESVPDFDLPGSSRSEPNRERWSSQDLRGKWLAVYFYPRDFTGGCTIEARGFEALHNEFLAADTEVIGISADSGVNADIGVQVDIGVNADLVVNADIGVKADIDVKTDIGVNSGDRGP